MSSAVRTDVGSGWHRGGRGRCCYARQTRELRPTASARWSADGRRPVPPVTAGVFMQPDVSDPTLKGRWPLDRPPLGVAHVRLRAVIFIGIRLAIASWHSHAIAPDSVARSVAPGATLLATE